MACKLGGENHSELQVSKSDSPCLCSSSSVQQHHPHGRCDISRICKCHATTSVNILFHWDLWQETHHSSGTVLQSICGIQNNTTVWSTVSIAKIFHLRWRRSCFANSSRSPHSRKQILKQVSEMLTLNKHVYQLFGEKIPSRREKRTMAARQYSWHANRRKPRTRWHH